MNTLTHLTTDDQGHTLLYDAWNRFFAVLDGQNHVIESYTYDGLGRRVTVTNASGELTNISYSSGGQVLEEDDDGSVLTRNVWSPVYANALLLRDRDTNADGILDQRLYFTSDANFNVTGVLNASGNVVQRQVYDAYGTVAFTDANWDTRATDNYALENLYQGMQYDAAIGWYVTPTRLYSPTLKVWNRTEPSDGVPYVDGPNLYQAFAANPINRRDPTGLIELDDDGFPLGNNHPQRACQVADDGVRELQFNHQLKDEKPTDIAELNRQIERQVAGLNRIIEKEGIEGLKRRIQNYNSEIEQAGRAYVRTLPPAGVDAQGNELAWLDEPDMGLGGGPEDVTTVGNLRINSIIGGQVQRLRRVILNMSATTKKIVTKVVLTSG